MFEKEFHFFLKAMYYLPMFFGIAIAVVLIWAIGDYFKIKKNYRIIVAVLVSFLVSLCWIIPIKQEEKKTIAKYNEQKEKYEQAKAVFDEQCKKAGEKIYRTVDNVDGIMLLKVRGREEHEINKTVWEVRADPMWSHAAIANLEYGNYIENFLVSGGKKQYLFVDVLEKDGSISRYLDYKGREYVDIKNPNDPARYAVTYENNVDPELRKHWVAGITIKIIDRQTDELLAEKTIFSFEPGLGSKATGRDPWVNAVHCPELKQRWEDHNPTRTFVFQVLKLSQPLNSQE